MTYDLHSSEGKAKRSLRAAKKVAGLGKVRKTSLSNKSESIAQSIKTSGGVPLSSSQREMLVKLRVFNKTFLILTLVIMLYDLTGRASAAEAPSSAGELATSQSEVSLVRHDPVNFDQIDPQITKPNVDSSIHPAAAVASVSSDNAKQVTAVDDSIVSAEAPPVVETAKPIYSPGGFVNQFPYGYCTWYVASKRPIPWNGNAIVWYSQAIAYGFKVGNVPAVGAIMVTSESYLGHVAYVEAVNPDGSWVVSEMNYYGWGIISSRTIKPGTIPVIGFIY